MSKYYGDMYARQRRYWDQLDMGLKTGRQKSSFCINTCIMISSLSDYQFPHMNIYYYLKKKKNKSH